MKREGGSDRPKSITSKGRLWPIAKIFLFILLPVFILSYLVFSYFLGDLFTYSRSTEKMLKIKNHFQELRNQGIPVLGGNPERDSKDLSKIIYKFSVIREGEKPEVYIWVWDKEKRDFLPLNEKAKELSRSLFP